MSHMGRLYLEIELMLEQGMHPSRVAELMECPESVVLEILDSMEHEMSIEELFSPVKTINS